MRAYSVCLGCCGVSPVGVPCPTCSGEPADLRDAEGAGLGAAPPRPAAPPLRRAATYLLGVAIGLAAFALIVAFGS
jgi:hypothetical protein